MSKFKFKVGDVVQIRDSFTGDYSGPVRRIEERKMFAQGPAYRIEGYHWYWESHLEFPRGDNITITFNLKHPKSARAFFEAALEQCRKPDPWTDRDINRARTISKELLYSLENSVQDLNINLSYQKNERVMRIEMFDHGLIIGAASATASDRDEFNYEIGFCILLCKLLGTDIPKFILEKNT